MILDQSQRGSAKLSDKSGGLSPSCYLLGIKTAVSD